MMIKVGDVVKGVYSQKDYVVLGYTKNGRQLSLKQLDNGQLAVCYPADVSLAKQKGDHLEKESEIDQTLSERGSRYGSFASVAQISQDLKDVMHKAPNWGKLTASQKEALEMVQHKIARMLNGDPTYIDNPVDIVGYATLMMKNMQGDLSI